MTSHQVTAQKIISLIDLTSLNESDTEQTIKDLCQKARKSEVAAVCVLPRFVRLATEELSASSVRVATVINFPTGEARPEDLKPEIDQVLRDGAIEIDFVIPWRHFKATESKESLTTYISHMVDLCKPASTKAILESSELPIHLVQAAAAICYAQGVNFVKTSTGKIPGSAASISAADAITQIAAKHDLRRSGFKASGGIKRYQDAVDIIDAVVKNCGWDYINRERFRIGASGLLDSLIGA